jgi:two-component system response regulator YesN
MFKKETGENFIAYLIRLRMKKAAELVIEAKLSMQMVAEDIGFNDASYFSRSFKKYFGISPEDYRRKFYDGSVS